LVAPQASDTTEVDAGPGVIIDPPPPDFGPPVEDDFGEQGGETIFDPELPEELLPGVSVAGLKCVPLSKVTISTRVGSLKIFANKYIFKYAELTVRQLLANVEIPEYPERTKPGYSEADLKAILDCYEGSEDYTEIRDRAMFYCYAATGLRLSELGNLDMSEIDLVTGDINTTQKGDFERASRVSDKALKVLRKYLKIRRAEDGCDRIFTTWRGMALSYSGLSMIFRRLNEATGIDWAHAHCFPQHHHPECPGQRRGAPVHPGRIGWKSDRMARRYAGASRQRTAARRMPELSLV
jgi:integrase